jgi:hypothetical protein
MDMELGRLVVCKENATVEVEFDNYDGGVNAIVVRILIAEPAKPYEVSCWMRLKT